MAPSSLHGKLSTVMELKVSPHKYFEHFISPYLTVNSSPKVINKVDLLDGQWGKQGCHILWDFYLDGKLETAEEIIEVIDHKNMRAEYNVIGGSLLEGFETFKFILAVRSKGNANCFVRWAVEYKKTSESILEPNAIIEVLNYMNQCIEAYLYMA